MNLGGRKDPPDFGNEGGQLSRKIGIVFSGVNEAEEFFADQVTARAAEPETLPDCFAASH